MESSSTQLLPLTLDYFKKETCRVQSFLTENGILPVERYNDDTSIMFPPIPSNNYPDAYPDDGYPNGRPKKEQFQLDQETEIIAYRVLQNLKRGFVVIQSLEYTQEQNSLFGNDGLKPQGGENDLLVLGDNFCCIFEVKRLKELQWYELSGSQESAEDRRRRALIRLLEDGRRQGERTRQLIDNIMHCFHGNKSGMNLFVYVIVGGLDSDEAMLILGADYNKKKLQYVLFLEDLTRAR